ncbi:MAG: hypothetical protein AAB573_03900 [Patescibacteria group bacterium]
MTTIPERILKPAILYKGKLWVARNHWRAIQMISARQDGYPDDLSRTDSGFVTNRKRFVDRKIARHIAGIADQIINPYTANRDYLCSEDLK